MKFEPYSIKAVEPIPFLSRKQRSKELKSAGYNVFQLKSKSVTIDLVSDSGTGTMSVLQWRKMIMADEAFAYQQSYQEFISAFKKISGYDLILPIHQARAAEHLLFSTIVKRGERVFANNLFATTKYHLKKSGAKPLELPVAGSGNIDIEKLKRAFRKGDRLVILSITSNHHGGQPVRLENIVELKKHIKKQGILIFDACRFAENAYLESQRVKKGLRSVVKKIFSLSDIFYLSTKKDLLTNIGGVIAVRNRKLYDQLNAKILCYEGFPTHGGLAGRDLSVIAQGLKEVMDPRHLSFRIRQVRELGEKLKKNGIPVLEPFGCHAIAIRGKDFVGNTKYPGFSGAAAIYLEGGIRTGVFYEDEEIIRLAIPRRVYTDAQLEYVVEIVTKAWQKKGFPKLNPVYQPPHLKNFLIRFKRS